MPAPAVTDTCSAALIARFLKARGVDRVFALCGGHIMPIWMRLDAEGIRIVDVRDERAAVYMAHAYGELSGRIGVALVTAGPGVTNAMTGIANAHAARAPLLILSGTPPRAQENRGALQDMLHTEFVRPLTRYARTVREPDLVLQELDEALARAAGLGGEPGPVYLDFPVDTQRAEPSRAMNEADVARVVRAASADRTAPRPRSRGAGGRTAVGSKAPAGHHRPRCARRRRSRWCNCSTALARSTSTPARAVAWCREDHPSVVAAMRGSVMGEADVIVTIGRRLDFQLAYGSPAVFGEAKFIRIADTPSELRDNRRAAVELFATPSAALSAIVAAAPDRASAADRGWAQAVRSKHLARADKLLTSMAAAAPGSDGLMHPNRLLAALRAAHPGRCDRRGRRRRLPQLRACRPAGADHAGPGPAGLHRHRHALRHCRGAGLPGADGGRCHRRRRLRLQCDGDRHRGAPPGAGADRGGEQRVMGHRGA